MKIHGTQVAVILAEGFDRDELHIALEALKEAGATIEILAENETKLKTGVGGLRATRTILNALPEEYDGLLIPGGIESADRMRDSLLHIGFVRHFMDTEKPIAAVSHAAWLLADAGVLQGRTLTSAGSIKKDLERAGAIWHDREIVADKNLITGRKKSDMSILMRAFIEELARIQQNAHHAA